MTLEQRIDALLRMGSAEKKAAWREAYKTPAPPACGSGLLGRAIAHRWQEKAKGGLTREELRQLARLAVIDGKTRDGKVAPTIKAGTWLSRTWHGEKHEVVVLDTGYEYRGERFASLTAIARRITGAGWSGPRFFGLMSPRLGKLGVVRDGQ